MATNFQWDESTSLEHARHFCPHLTLAVAREVRLVIQRMGELPIAGGTHRVGIGARGAVEVQRREGSGWVRDMGTEATPPLPVPPGSWDPKVVK
jgi:hypothetical protein